MSTNEVIFFERDALGVQIASWQPADSERCTQVHIIIPMQVGEQRGAMQLRFRTAAGIDAFTSALQAEREATFGPYGHVPAHCTHCGSRVSRQDPDGIREHTMTCEKNPLVVLLGEKCRRLVELQEAYEHMVDLRRRDVQKLGGLEAQLVDALPTEDERQVLRWIREVLQQQSPTAHADIRYGAALELLKRLLVLRMNCAA